MPALDIVRTRCRTAAVLACIEQEGMMLDRGRVEEEYVAAQANLGRIDAALRTEIGGINLNSPDQKAALFYDTLKLPERQDRRGHPLRTGKGKRRTDATTMEWLGSQAKTPAQKSLFSLLGERAKASALLSKNLEFFHGVATERGGLFFGQFSQIVAATHRLSSSGMPQQFAAFKGPKSVQFQNMPRSLKRCFTTRHPDYLMVEADASQLEFRVAAFLGQDTQAKLDIDDPDFDAHVTSAAEMVQVPYDDLLAAYRAGDPTAKKFRQEAKADTFKPLFGGSIGTPAQERWYTAFRNRYSELYAVQQEWYDQVLASGGDLVTPWGLVFHWDYYFKPGNDTAYDHSTHKPIKQAVFNYPIQSLATAEIIPIALFSLYDRCKARALRVRFVNTIHDSVVAEVHKEDIHAYVEEAQQAFTTDVYKYLRRYYRLSFDVTLGCEIKYGTHWGEGQEVKFNLKPGAR